jgi:hypothetical protein
MDTTHNTCYTVIVQGGDLPPPGACGKGRTPDEIFGVTPGEQGTDYLERPPETVEKGLTFFLRKSTVHIRVTFS